MQTYRLDRIPMLAMLGATVLLGCDEVKEAVDDAVDDAVSSEVDGQVVDDRGQPVKGVRVQLYSLLDNENFVEGSDVGSAQAYIDREAVLESTNTIASATTDDQGRFSIDGVPPGAFLASATHEACSAGFAGFDEETGILNLDTLIKPKFDNGLSFSIPTFVVACGTAPEVGPDGNSAQAPPFDPPAPAVTCDADSCTAAGGTCEDGACVVTCAPERCAESGGSCVDGACVLPACNEAACTDAGGTCEGDVCVMAACDPTVCADARGTCSEDGTSCGIPACFAAEAECTAAGGTCSSDGAACELPVCSSDDDCEAGQAGAYCANPGDVALATCEPPLPGEIVPPAEAVGWTGLRITDTAGNLLADASAASQTIDPSRVPTDGIVRVYADYSGTATGAHIHVQSGGTNCRNLPPRTDSIAVELASGGLATGQGDFVELVLHGGYQKIQLSTSDVLGEGERSFAVEVGDPCAAWAHPFVAILAWDAGPAQPADLDLNIWNGAGELVFVGKKQAAWGRLALEGKGPGPEVFEALDASQGPFTVKVQFFSGKPRVLEGKLRILRTVDGQARDETFSFTVGKPKDVAEIGSFATE